MTAPITLFEILPDKFKTLPKIKTQLAATRVNLRKTYSLIYNPKKRKSP